MFFHRLDFKAKTETATSPATTLTIVHVSVLHRSGLHYLKDCTFCPKTCIMWKNVKFGFWIKNIRHILDEFREVGAFYPWWYADAGSRMVYSAILCPINQKINSCVRLSLSMNKGVRRNQFNQNCFSNQMWRSINAFIAISFGKISRVKFMST